MSQSQLSTRVRPDLASTPPMAQHPAVWRWLDERLSLGALYRKYGRKAFPVHSSFFLGEMALFAFIILVVTGIYLGFIYVPSNAEITVDGQTVPEAYASVELIESIPVANLFRNTHHWAAHVMVAAVLLHMLRVFFTGTYRKPREINWVIGILLLALTLLAAFVGYALPYDSYAVTATGIGFAIARSIPWAGPVVSEFIFGGAFPTLGSLSRLYTIHIFVVPLLLAATVGLHLLIVGKQKHTQPGYARPLAEPGKVLGVPLWPYQALLAGQLLLLMFGALFLLSAVVPPHPIAEFGPPGPATPEVKPDWYLLWVYGFLKIVPPQATVSLFGATIGPNFIGGVLFPTLLFGLITIAPWLDRTNRQEASRFEYLEPVRQTPVRLATGSAVLTFLATLFLAAYYDEIGLSLFQIWAIVILAPVLVAVLFWAFVSRTAPAVRFDPRASANLVMPTSMAMPTAPAAAPLASDTLTFPLAESQAELASELPSDSDGWSRSPAFATPAARSERARDSLVAALHEFGELAPLIRQIDDEADLLEVLDYVDSLRLGLTESNQVLQGVIRGHLADEQVVFDGGREPDRT